MDVKGIVEVYGLDKKVLAKELFPNNRYASVALSRVLMGKAELNASQIHRLAEIAGTSVDDLYNLNGKWKMQSGHGVVTLATDQYRVEINLVNYQTKLYRKDVLLSVELIGSQIVSVREFIKQIETKIKEYEN